VRSANSGHADFLNINFSHVDRNLQSSLLTAPFSSTHVIVIHSGLPARARSLLLHEQRSEFFAVIERRAPTSRVPQISRVTFLIDAAARGAFR
jgi:hypothetical protein